MKRFSLILMVSALAVLLTVDVSYFCSNSAVLSQLNASSSSGSSSSASSSSASRSSEPSSTSSSVTSSSASYSSSASASDRNLGGVIKLIWRACELFAVTYTVEEGVEKIVGENKVGYSAWVASTYVKKVTEYPDGRKETEYGKKRTCTKFDGKQNGNCSPVNTSEFLD